MAFNETINITFETNYTTSGEKNPTFLVYSGNFSDTITDKFTVNLLEILENNALYGSLPSTLFEMLIKNNVERQNVSWDIFTGEEIIQSTEYTSLNNSNYVFVFIETNYSEVGGYVTLAETNSSSYQHALLGEVVVQ